LDSIGLWTQGYTIQLPKAILKFLHDEKKLLKIFLADIISKFCKLSIHYPFDRNIQGLQDSYRIAGMLFAANEKTKISDIAHCYR